jgi:predicted phosphodiesterase
MAAQDIVVMGDIHGEFGKLNTWVNYKRPSVILQCGDFGYWPRYKSKRERKRGKPLVPKMHNTKLYWCDGNHEDFWGIQERQTDEVFPNVFYMPRGSILTLPDKRKVLFVGGAESDDKDWRVEQEAAGGDKIWFAEERISQNDISSLPDISVDVIISHAAPREFSVWGGEHDMIHPDPSRLALSAILHRYKEHRPLWFFGHYHARITGEYQGVKYFGLNMIGCTDWWMRLPDSEA